MDQITVRDATQIGTMLIACGVFIQQARSTHIRVEQHEKRLTSVESLAATSAGLLAQAGRLLDKVDTRLDRHEREAPCKEHTATMGFINKEVERLRVQVDRIAGEDT
jgi:hypothetical protein